MHKFISERVKKDASKCKIISREPCLCMLAGHARWTTVHCLASAASCVTPPKLFDGYQVKFCVSDSFLTNADFNFII